MQLNEVAPMQLKEVAPMRLSMKSLQHAPPSCDSHERDYGKVASRIEEGSRQKGTAKPQEVLELPPETAANF